MKRYVPLFESEKTANSLAGFEKMLVDLLKDSYDNAVKKIEKYYDIIINIYFKDREDDMTPPYAWDRNDGTLILPLVIQDKKTKIFSKRNNYDIKKKELAEQEVTRVQQSYMARLRSKLWEILQNKEIEEIKLLHLELKQFYEAEFLFIFADGSQFVLHSQIVYVTNQHGTFFVRYPNIYQNIIMADGIKYKKQSEDWMVSNFVGLDLSAYKMKKKADIDAKKNIAKVDRVLKKKLEMFFKKKFFYNQEQKEINILYGDFDSSMLTKIEFTTTTISKFNMTYKEWEKLVDVFAIEKQKIKNIQDNDSKNYWGDKYKNERNNIEIAIENEQNKFDELLSVFQSGHKRVIIVYKDGTTMEGEIDGSVGSFGLKTEYANEIRYPIKNTKKYKSNLTFLLDKLHLTNVVVKSEGEMFANPDRFIK